MLTPDGKILHAVLEFGDSKLMLSDEFPEMGGKSAKIVLDDCPEFAMEVAQTMLVFHAGQGCAVQSRLLGAENVTNV